MAPPPNSQGRQPSCVAWAVAYGLKSIQEAIEQGWSPAAIDHQFSPAFVYNQIMNGTCTGTYIPTALNIIKGQGCASLATMPYDPLDCRTQPTGQAISEATPFTIDHYSSLEVIDAQSIKEQLAGGLPVILAIHIDEAFNALTSADPVWESHDGNFLGFHAVLAVGYEDETETIKVMNSWGQDFGDGGYFWITYDFVPEITREAYVAYDHIGPADASRIVLYEHPAFGGDLRVIREDTPDLDLGTIDFADVTSSLMIYGLQGVRLYDGKNYTGAELTLTENTSDLTLFDFNDRIGSVDVYPYQHTGPYITLYQDANYQGDSRVIRVDTPDLDLGTINFADVASSVRFYGLQGVRLYDGRNFTGSELTLTGDVPNLSQYSFNDRTGSVDVYPYSSTGPSITLFQHPNYQGDSRVIRLDTPDLDLGSINFADVASSVRFNGLQGVRLYDGRNYTGSELTLTSDVPDLTIYDFNDRTGSVDVYPYIYQDSSAILFQHPGYQGDSRVIREDTPDLDLGTINFADVTSSIMLNELQGVRLYDGRNYTGAELTITANTSDLTLYNFNDRTGSVDVYPYIYQDRYIILYQHPNYQGDSRIIRVDTPDLDLGTINFADVASSVKFHGVQGARLYDGHQYTGGSLTLTGDVPDLTSYNFNDRTGSVDIYPYR